MTTANPTPNASPIAYAMPIGGGWAYICASCFDAHRDDIGSDSDAVADCEPIVEFSAGANPECEVCEHPING